MGFWDFQWLPGINWSGPNSQVNLPGSSFDLGKPAAKPQVWNYDVAPYSAGYGRAWEQGGRVLPTPPPTKTATRTKRPSGPDPNAAAKAAAAAAAKAAADARAEAEAAMRRSGERFQSQAGNLDPQIAALRRALDFSFRQSLDQNLVDIDSLLEEQFDILKQGAGKRALQFLEGARDTEKATAAQAEGSLSNLVRERQDSLSAVLEQGAGQTDALRAMINAARNWHANAQEGNRAYFDSMRSTNSAINDLNVDTQTALANAHRGNESERERLWQDFYNRRSETYTQLGNAYQQQADYLDMAKENKVGEGGGEKKTLAGQAFMDASNEAGQSYKRNALPDWIKGYQGQALVDTRVGNSDLASATTVEPLSAPEGATLRRWG